MSVSTYLRLIARLSAAAADVADGKVPDPSEAEALALDVVNALGAAYVLRGDLTPAAKARVDAEIEAEIKAKTGG